MHRSNGMKIISRVVDGTYHWEAVDEQTGQVVQSIIIPKIDLEKWTIFSRELLYTKAESENDDYLVQLSKVPKSALINLGKIWANAAKLTKEHFAYTEPMIKSIVTSVTIELEISTLCNQVWKELSADNFVLAAKHLRLAGEAIQKLKNHKDTYRSLAVDASSYIDMLKKREQQFLEQVSKVDKKESPKIYTALMNDYSEFKSGNELCAYLQAQIPEWNKAEAIFLKAAQDAFHLINRTMINPNSKNNGDLKEGSIQPASPTVVKSSGADSKEDSPVNSRNRSSSDESNDSPNLKPLKDAISKISVGLPQSIFGNNIKPLPQSSAPSKVSNPPAFNPAYSKVQQSSVAPSAANVLSASQSLYTNSKNVAQQPAFQENQKQQPVNFACARK